MNWVISGALVIGLAGVICLVIGTIVARRNLRRLSLQRLSEPAVYTFSHADAIARRLSLQTGIPHHAKLTTHGRWIVVAMEEGE